MPPVLRKIVFPLLKTSSKEGHALVDARLQDHIREAVKQEGDTDYWLSICEKWISNVPSLCLTPQCLTFAWIFYCEPAFPMIFWCSCIPFNFLESATEGFSVSEVLLVIYFGSQNAEHTIIPTPDHINSTRAYLCILFLILNMNSNILEHKKRTNFFYLKINDAVSCSRGHHRSTSSDQNFCFCRILNILTQPSHFYLGLGWVMRGNISVAGLVNLPRNRTPASAVLYKKRQNNIKV